jgi:hypothetical protein
MYVSLNRVPVYQWTHREFDGTDPWAEDRPVRWSVVAYRMLSETFVAGASPAAQVVPSESNAVPGKFAMGIFARVSGRYRVFPNALQDLWRAGRVPDDDIPWLLHQIEQPLRRSDYPSGTLPLVMLFLGIAFAVFALPGVWISPGFGMTLVLLAVVCLGSHAFWRSRRRAQAAQWAALMQTRALSRLVSAAGLIPSGR